MTTKIGTYSGAQVLKDLDLLNGLMKISEDVNFADKIRDIGVKLFTEIFSSEVDHLYRICTGFPEFSLSFTVSKDQVYFPVEFLSDGIDPLPVSTTYPVYKTITTREKFFPKKDQLNPNDEVNVLLLTSNTFCNLKQSILNVDTEEKSPFILPEVSSIDGDESEAKGIKNLINDLSKEPEPGKPVELWRKTKVEWIKTDALTYDKFEELVGSNKYDIIHYNGHGYFDSNKSDNSSIFLGKTKKAGQVVKVNANKLNQILENKSRLKFVYLSCCKGGASLTVEYKSLSNSFVGLLHSIVTAGVPTVLGMRWPISVPSAKTLSQYFYKALFSNENNTIEEALMKTRRSTHGNPDHSIWCSPILVKQDI